MTFSLHEGVVVMFSLITHAQSFNIHHLSHILGTCALISAVAPFYCLTFTVVAYHSSEGDTPQERRRAVRKNTDPSKNGFVKINTSIYVCSRAFHSFLSLANCHSASTIIGLQPKTTLTPSIKPNFGVLRTLH